MDMGEERGTVKRYWQDPYETKFEAEVVKAWQENPRETKVVLESTAFYPEKGGQPWDLGRIGVGSGSSITWFEVQKVIEDEGQIVHTVLGPRDLFEPGVLCQAEIDWQRRFDHMQQHTGQHILSRAFEKLFDAETVGFHMGKDYVSIDLTKKTLSQEEMERAEDLSNQIVFGDLPVTVEEYMPGEIPEGIRDRVIDHSGVTRVVYIDDFDACACGGTHVKRTGEVGLIKLLRADKAHGGIRIFFVCGKRALDHFRLNEAILTEASSLISQAPLEIPKAILALQERIKDLEKKVRLLDETLIEMEIEKALKADAGSSVLVRAFSGKSPQVLRLMAQRISYEKKVPGIFFSNDPAFNLVVCVPNEKKGDAQVLSAKLAQCFEAKGGGNSKVAQIGLKEPLGLSDEEIQRKIRECLGLREME